MNNRFSAIILALSVAVFGVAPQVLADPTHNPPLVCAARASCSTCPTRDGCACGCILVTLDLGSTTVWTGQTPVYLRIHSSDESASLSTPAQLKVVMGWSFKAIGGGTTAGGAPQIVRFVQPEGAELVVHFQDGDSVGVPEPNNLGKSLARVQMVDAEGWATTSAPAFYDLYPGDGSVWRFLATGNTNERGALVSFTDPRGRVLTTDDFGVDIVRDSLGNIRQVKTLTRLADVRTLSPTHYAVTVYPLAEEPEQVADTGLYALPEHAPTRVLDVAQGESVKELLVGFQKGTGDVRQYRYVAVNGDWTLHQPSGLVEAQELYFTEDESGAQRLHTIRDETGKLWSRDEYNYVSAYWGYLITNRIEGIPGDATRTTSWSYYTDGPHKDLLRETVEPTGNRILYEYDDKNRVVRESMPLVEEETLYSYEPVDPSDPPLLCDTRPRCVVRKMQGVEIQRTYYVYGTNGVDVVERVGEQGAAYGGTNVLRTVTTYYPVTGAVSDGLVQSVRHEDGSIDEYSYSFEDGEWTTYSSHVHEQTPHPSKMKTVRSAVIYDAQGRVLRWSNELLSNDGAWIPIQQEDYRYDIEGNIIRKEELDGKVSTSEWGGNCCGKTSETTWDGIQSVFSYDSEGRVLVKRTLQPSVKEMRFGYDVLGREVSVYETNYVEHIGSFEKRTRYDSLGRVVALNNPWGLWMEIEYANGGRTQRIREYSGLERILSFDMKGRQTSILGTAIPNRTYQYGVSSDGNVYRTTFFGSSDASVRWERETWNMLGQSIELSCPGIAGTVRSTEYFYDPYGHLISQTDSIINSENVQTIDKRYLFAYDFAEDQTVRALDADLNGRIDYDGEDEIILTKSNYTESSDGVWYERQDWTFPEFNSTSSVCVSRQRRKLTGLINSFSEEETINRKGQLSRAVMTFDHSSFDVTTFTKDFNATNLAKTLVRYGQPLLSVSASGVTNTFRYDGLGRQIEFVDGRGNRTQKRYSQHGVLTSLEQPSGYQVEYEYDELGRQVSATDSLGRVFRTGYDQRGHIIHRDGWTYPQWFAYDHENRMVSYGTTRTNQTDTVSELSINSDGLDVTRWQFDEATGLLISKQYPDGNGPSFTYYSNGLLHTRTWARGVVSTYEYDSKGSLKSIQHSDSTPSVSFERDRTGRIVQATVDGGITNIFCYSQEGVCTNEIQQGVSISRQYQWPSCNFAVSVRGAGFSYEPIQYDFGPDGRLDMVSTGDHSFEYRYLDGSELVEEVLSSAGHRRLLSYSKNADFVSGVTNSCNGIDVSAFNYERDILGRITTESRNQDTISYVYDALSQITGKTHADNVFGGRWNYDLIGNATNFMVLDSQHSQEFNELNQLVSIRGDDNKQIQYDIDGNLTDSGDGWQYSWDANNRLTTAVSNGIAATFSYDAFGRLSRIVQTGNTNVVLEWIWDGNNILAEISRGQNDVETTLNIWGSDVNGTINGAGGVGGLLAKHKTTGWYIPFFNANGDVVNYVDDAGQSYAELEYDTKGCLLDGSRVDTGLVHQYSTKPFLESLGLMLYQKRIYRPDLGVWLNRDAKQEKEGAGLYSFLLNNAVNHYDYLGLSVVVPSPATPPTPAPGCHVEYITDRRRCFCSTKDGRIYTKTCGTKCPPSLFDGFIETGHWIQVCDPPEEPPETPDPEPAPPVPEPEPDLEPAPEPAPPPIPAPVPAPNSIVPPPKPPAPPRPCCESNDKDAMVNLVLAAGGGLPKIGVLVSAASSIKSGCHGVNQSCKEWSRKKNSFILCLHCCHDIANVSIIQIGYFMCIRICIPLFDTDPETW
jgi:RHS repeat-associated protein